MNMAMNWLQRVKDQNFRPICPATDGFNNKAKVVTGRAFGFLSVEVQKIALYPTLGDPPEPVFTHKFC